MEEFFQHLNDLRNKYAGTSEPGVLHLYSSTYLMLMNADSRLSTSEQALLKSFLSKAPESADESHHFVWGLNAIARYYCFITREYEESGKYLTMASEYAEKFPGMRFSEYEEETRCIPLIVRLNVARLKLYQGDLISGKAQLKALENEIRNLRNDIKASLLSKIEHERHKWGLV